MRSHLPQLLPVLPVLPWGRAHYTRQPHFPPSPLPSPATATAAEALDRELRETEDALRPLHAALEEATDRCRDQARKIAASKANVAKNDARIQELMRMVVFK